MHSKKDTVVRLKCLLMEAALHPELEPPGSDHVLGGASLVPSALPKMSLAPCSVTPVLKKRHQPAEDMVPSVLRLAKSKSPAKDS